MPSAPDQDGTIFVHLPTVMLHQNLTVRSLLSDKPQPTVLGFENVMISRIPVTKEKSQLLWSLSFQCQAKVNIQVVLIIFTIHNDGKGLSVEINNLGPARQKKAQTCQKK